MCIKILLADDHALIREGIKTVITKEAKDIAVIGEAKNGREVLALAEKNSFDVYILDISMPLLNGIETSKRLLSKGCARKIIILSMHDDNDLVEEALQCGVKGYLLKDDPLEVIVYAIREVYGGRFFLSPSISFFVVRKFLENIDTNNKNKGRGSFNLSSREKEILQLIAEGLNNSAIASLLKLSVNTISTHRRNIMKKLDIHTTVDLVRYALKKETAPSL